MKKSVTMHTKCDDSLNFVANILNIIVATSKFLNCEISVATTYSK